jgi:hypothetical protein
MKIKSIIERTTVLEEKRQSQKEVTKCWPGYKQVGWQKGIKGKKQIPKCVPDNDSENDDNK